MASWFQVPVLQEIVSTVAILHEKAERERESTLTAVCTMQCILTHEIWEQNVVGHIAQTKTVVYSYGGILLFILRSAGFLYFIWGSCLLFEK